MDENSEWCNSFVLPPKANGKAKLCLDLHRLNKTLIRPVHAGLTLNNILPRLAGMKYLTLMDTNSGYHYLKLAELLSYFKIFL